MKKKKTTAKRSPAPWELYGLRYDGASKPYRYQIRDANNNIIAVTASYGEHAGAPIDYDIIAANAKLLASAPALLRENGKLKRRIRELEN